MTVGAQFFVIIQPVVIQCPEWDSIPRSDFTVCVSLYTQRSMGHHKHIYIVPSHTRCRREKFCSAGGGGTNIHSDHRLPHTFHGGSHRTPTHTPVVGQHVPTHKYHCALPINPSHIASIPHTSSLQLHISVAEWNDTTREPYIHQPLDRHLRLQQIQAPRRIPPWGEEADCLWPSLRNAARVIRSIFPPHNWDQAPLPVTGLTRNFSQINVMKSTVNQHNT